MIAAGHTSHDRKDENRRACLDGYVTVQFPAQSGKNRFVQRRTFFHRHRLRIVKRGSGERRKCTQQRTDPQKTPHLSSPVLPNGVCNVPEIIRNSRCERANSLPARMFVLQTLIRESRVCGNLRSLSQVTTSHLYVSAGGMNDMARSARAVMVSEGFTPGLADIAAPSITERPS